MCQLTTNMMVDVKGSHLKKYKIKSMLTTNELPFLPVDFSSEK